MKNFLWHSFVTLSLVVRVYVDLNTMTHDNHLRPPPCFSFMDPASLEQKQL